MTTTNLHKPTTLRARFDGLPLPLAIAICVFSLIAIAFLVGRLQQAPAIAVQPTPALPIIVLATPAPSAPQPTPAAVVAVQLPRFVVAYDQPVNGAALGAIPAPDASAVVARYGASWVMVPWDGGNVWLRAADVGLPDVADLQPTEAPRYVVVNVPVDAAPTPEPGYYQVVNQQAGDFSSEPPPALQTLVQSAGDEPLSPALLREAQDR